ncbi:hypothetical protein UFOVP180_27 [uncultured Caudovirales phage]|uniref:Uncharacterized protein n=1 Tax=uncultured Caudovirales phage TaxID=2100421 RepID=A0A6J7WDH5_9CAUD|nr:hypothetical protein UFOVP180_27 [uncultured Caudovirales phage]
MATPLDMEQRPCVNVALNMFIYTRSKITQYFLNDLGKKHFGKIKHKYLSI